MLTHAELLARLCEVHDFVKRSTDPYTAPQSEPVTSLLEECNPNIPEDSRRAFEHIAKELLTQTSSFPAEQAMRILFPIFALFCTQPPPGGFFGEINLELARAA